jgi:hypothetical protein
MQRTIVGHLDLYALLIHDHLTSWLPEQDGEGDRWMATAVSFCRAPMSAAERFVISPY